MRFLAPRHAALAALLAPGIQACASSSPLVVWNIGESAHMMCSTSSETFSVDARGKMTYETVRSACGGKDQGHAVTNCGRLSQPELDDLRARARMVVEAADVREPDCRGPEANYTRSESLVVDVAGRNRQVSMSWCGPPEAARPLAEATTRLKNACLERGETARPSQ
ncbi:MAG TPA: hypothetical protein VJ801_02290 [Polyangia bacterium]|nr:hypothetical protein [Polyangia bacterium]